MLKREEKSKTLDGKYKKEIFKQEYYIQPEKVVHKRTTYDLVGLLGDMGGIQGILISILGILCFPISEHSFNIKAARKLFMARLAQQNLF